MPRAFVIVMDACGVGALPDAAAYGDAPASNTLAHVAALAGGLELPALGRSGSDRSLELEGVAPAADAGAARPAGAARARQGVGHRALGDDGGGPDRRRCRPTRTASRMRSFARSSAATGQRFCCNAPYSGTQVIEDFGERHLRTGELILYTSADSVLQIAAHNDVLDEPALHRVCAQAREVMRGEHAVGRVIARPFKGVPGAFVRTPAGTTTQLSPPARSYLEELRAAGVTVHGVGKIRDLFAGVGVDVAPPRLSQRRGDRLRDGAGALA